MDGGAEDKAAISVEAAFKALTEYVDRFDPAQASLSVIAHTSERT